MKILIFDNIETGHHIEYVHHLYNYAGKMMKDDVFIFVLAEGLLHNHKDIDFNKYANIQTVAIKKEENYKIKKGIFKNWRNWYHDYKLLRKYINLYQPEKVVLNALFHFMPFLAFSRVGKNLLSGILYIIPDRKPKNRSLINRWADKVRLFLYAKGKIFKHVFLLNDTEYPSIYNKMYNTAVFKYLPDPYVNTPTNIQTNHITINTQKKVFLHFGGMGYRKGTIDILNAIQLMDEKELDKCLFIFAGVFTDKDLYQAFIEKITMLKKKVEIIHIDGFVPFEELAYFCSQANYVLVPYKNVEQSSGVINHAAKYGKAVVGPAEGLLGHLIKKYKLGYTLEKTNEKTLAKFIKEAVNNEHVPMVDGSAFLKNATPENFARIMLNS